MHINAYLRIMRVFTVNIVNTIVILSSFGETDHLTKVTFTKKFEKKILLLLLDHTITEQILTISIPTNPVLCSPMYFCFNLSCFFRVDVDESHRVSRIVGPNRNGRQIKRTETSTYLFEYVGVTRVTPEPVFPALK